MKILVLGAGGMAGHVVSLRLKESGFDIDTLSSSKKVDENTVLLDVMDKVKFEDYLKTKKYDVVINCIGVLIKKSEEAKEMAIYLNSFLPHFLEKYYRDSQTKVIHLSTDCVFSGKNAPYYENSPYDGELFYDRAKALGEIINDKDLTFRMSIIGPDMSEEGVGLFNWFAKQKGDIYGYTKAIWSGITTIELARGIEAAIEQNLTGLYHLVPKDNISKFELLKTFKDVFGCDGLQIKPKDDIAADKTLINTRKDFDFVVSDYRTMTEEMRTWIISHMDLYKHYKGVVGEK